MTVYCQHCGKVAVDPCFYDDDEQDKAYRDADRYRWLRERAFKDGGWIALEIKGSFDEIAAGSLAEILDEAIDRAMVQRPDSAGASHE